MHGYSHGVSMFIAQLTHARCAAVHLHSLRTGIMAGTPSHLKSCARLAQAWTPGSSTSPTA